jgi:hypothetical protein
MKRLILFLFVLSLFANNVFSQNAETTYSHGLFHGRRIVNGHSLELQKEGELEMYIGHRFGAINGGAYEFFGIDQADMRMAFDYGVKDWLAVGIGRSSYLKTFDSFAKVRLLRQSTGAKNMPISLTALSALTYETQKEPNNLPVNYYSRMAYTHQLLIGRKFSDDLSVQLMPTLTHINLVPTIADPNDIYTLGVAVRYRVSLNVAVTAEYYYNLTPLADNKYNSLALGFDIDTGSHVFQVHITNSSAMFERAFIAETTDSWTDGGIHLGFNMNRVFKLKGRRY